MTTNEIIERNKEFLSLEALVLENEAEKSAFASLTDKQIATLRSDVDGIENKYLHHTADEVVGVAMKWAEDVGELTAEDLFGLAHSLLDESDEWSIVKANSVEDLARKIVDNADSAIGDAIDRRAEKSGDWTEAQKWWDFVNAGGREAFTAALATIFKKDSAFAISYNNESYVVFEAPAKCSSLR